MDFALLFGIIIIILIIIAATVLAGSHVVPEGNCGIVYTFRKYSKTLQPGKCFVLPLIQRLRLVDMRPATSEFENKKVKTKDGLIIGMRDSLKWHVADPVKALKATDYKQSLEQATEQAVLRITKESLLEELNNDYAKTCSFIKENINQIMVPWGVTVDEFQYEKIAPSFD